MIQDFADHWLCGHDPHNQFLWLRDHFGSFNSDFTNEVLDKIPNNYTVFTEYQFPQEVHTAYPHLDLKFSSLLYIDGNHSHQMSRVAWAVPEHQIDFDNFLSCFNRSNQEARHLLLARLYQLGWYNPEYCTKHFKLNLEHLTHHGIDINTIGQDFVDQIDQIDFLSPVDHQSNFNALVLKMQRCFLHLVSETKSLDTTVCFPTEKFLYPIASKSFWLAMAPPNYHKMINQAFGFKLFTCIDYEFDSIWHPVARLEAILKILDHFSSMSQQQWRDIYRSQQHIIEYNYQHLASFGFFDQVVSSDQVPPLAASFIEKDRDFLQDDDSYQQYLVSKRKK